MTHLGRRARASVERNRDGPRTVSLGRLRAARPGSILASLASKQREKAIDMKASPARGGRPRWLKVLVALVGVFTVAVVAGFLYVTYVYVTLFRDISPPPLQFEAATWIAATSSTDKTRYRMHEDLLRSHPVIGMTRDEVAGLLGPPAQTAYFKEWDMVYPMGPEPGFGVDSVWLVLRLRDDRVVEHRVVTD